MKKEDELRESIKNLKMSKERTEEILKQVLTYKKEVKGIEGNDTEKGRELKPERRRSMWRRYVSAGMSVVAVAALAAVIILYTKDPKESETEQETQKKEVLEAMNDSTPIELSYAYWDSEDEYVVSSLIEGWNEMHPNASVTETMYPVYSGNDFILMAAASNTLPDVFMIMGGSEQYIKKGLFYDMSDMWQTDPDAQNVIGGINEFKLGYYGTQAKWTTPVKFNPSVMFLNLTAFNKLGEALPDADWTWEEFEQKCEALSKEYQGEKYYGISEGVTGLTVVKFYPIASDPDCIGEFGWDGTEFDLTNWAYGLELEKKWIYNDVKAPNKDTVNEYRNGMTGADIIEQEYGELFYPEERGYVAIRTDDWGCWERYWTTEDFYQYDTFFVPYVMPHTKDNQDSTNMFANFEFGGISSYTKHPLESYYLLKYMTWGADGWQWKLDHCDEIRSTAVAANRAAAGEDTDEADATGGEVIDNCPITSDPSIWAQYEQFHPNPDTPDPIADRLEAAGLSATARSDVFPEFWEKVKAGTWTCDIYTQVPGIYTALWAGYYGEEFNSGYESVEQAVILGNGSAADYVERLNKAFNEYCQNAGQE